MRRILPGLSNPGRGGWGTGLLPRPPSAGLQDRPSEPASSFSGNNSPCLWGTSSGETHRSPQKPGPSAERKCPLILIRIRRETRGQHEPLLRSQTADPDVRGSGLRAVWLTETLNKSPPRRQTGPLESETLSSENQGKLPCAGSRDRGRGQGDLLF